MSEFAVIFQPTGRTVYVLPGTLALEAAARAGLAVQTPCGGRGTCGKCRVRFIGETPAPNDADRKTFDASQLADGWRLACQHALTGPARLFVPQASVYGTAEQILTGHQQAKIHIQPAVRKRLVKLTPPTLDDPRDDWTRLREALESGDSSQSCNSLPCVPSGLRVAAKQDPACAIPGHRRLDIATPLLRVLPRLLRDNDWQVTATLADGLVIDLAGASECSGPGAVVVEPLGAAFDIGTTTVVGTLMNLGTGAELAVASRINPQTTFGDDVISRILLTREQPDGLGRLHDAIVSAIGEMLTELASEAGVKPEDICELSIAGNTTMQLLFAGVWPGPLGEIPFAAGFCDGLTLDSSEFRLPMHPCGRVYLLPSIGGFLGGDTVAGMLATNLIDQPGCCLLIDIGTNGEIVLSCDGKLWAASTAAGPAFEGARIGMGMRAAAGAIEKVLINHDVQVNVIGNVPAIGLCGTALIDAAAGLLNARLIDPAGRLAGEDDLPADLPAGLRGRIRGTGSQTSFMLTEPTREHRAVVLTQRDIRELQLASGAIRAGVAILLERAGVPLGKLDAVYLAGAFGNYIRRENAKRIGLLPDVPLERIHFVGNAASMGAKLTLLSLPAREQAEALARDVRRVDLSSDLEFQMKFAEAMIFPE